MWPFKNAAKSPIADRARLGIPMRPGSKFTPLAGNVVVAPAGSTVVLITRQRLSVSMREELRQHLRNEEQRSGVRFSVLDGDFEPVCVIAAAQ